MDRLGDNKDERCSKVILKGKVIRKMPYIKVKV